MSKPGDGYSIDKMAGGSDQRGSYYIDSAQAVTWGKYQYLVVNADAVFTVLQTNTDRNLLLAHGAGGDLGGGLNLAGVTVAKGMVIYPPDRETILNVTLSSGSVLAYG